LSTIRKILAFNPLIIPFEILKETNNAFLKPEEVKDLLSINNLPNTIDFFGKFKKLIKR